MEKSRFSSSQAGFSLLEVTIATAIMAGALVSLGQMFALSVSNNAASKNLSTATMLADQKMEQLRGLTWGFDTLGLPVSDTTTNTALPIEAPTGGTGLTPSPMGSMTQNMPGWVDYVDAYGNILGGGSVNPPPNTTYIRRWAIEPLPTNPNNTLVLHVLVTKHQNRGSADTTGSTVRLPDEARLVSVKTRKAQ